MMLGKLLKNRDCAISLVLAIEYKEGRVASKC